MRSNGPFSINQIPELLADHVKIRNIAEVEKKIENICNAGKEHLQIISDFDRTISRHHYEGKPTKSSYCVFESVANLPPDFVEKTRSLYNKFRVIEDDPNLTMEEKKPYMEEWWTLNDKLYVGIPYDLQSIEKAVVASEVMLRVGADKALKKLHEENIPVLIFSAGLGDVVTEILRHYNLMLSNIHVISNFFSEKDGIIQGFKGKTIHIYNKNQHAIENCDYFEELSHRENVILMGDSLGDANMNEGVHGNGSVLKIGFLSVNIDEYLPQYLENFDIVLLDDSSMDVFNAILAKVLKK